MNDIVNFEGKERRINKIKNCLEKNNIKSYAKTQE